MARDLRLVGLQSPVSNGALSGKALPNRIKVLSWGRNDTLRGPVILDYDSIKVFRHNQHEIGRERAPIDFDHSSVKGTEAYKALEGKAPTIFGYGTPNIVAGDGLWFEDIQWTPDGEKQARNFIDISPTPLLDEHNRVLAIHSCALTPAGAVDGLSFYSALLNLVTENPETHSMTRLRIFSTADDPSTPDAYRGARKIVDDQGLSKKGNMNKEHFDYFRRACKLDASASDEDVKKAALKHMAAHLPDEDDEETKLKHMSAMFEHCKPNPDPANPAHMNQFPSEGGPVYKQLVADVSQPLLAQISTLSAEIKAIRTAQSTQIANAEETQRNAEVKRVTDSGRVFPMSADNVKITPIAALKEMADNIIKQPLSVPTHRKTLREIALGADGKPAGRKATMADSARAFDEDAAMAGPRN